MAASSTLQNVWPSSSASRSPPWAPELRWRGSRGPAAGRITLNSVERTPFRMPAKRQLHFLRKFEAVVGQGLLEHRDGGRSTGVALGERGGDRRRGIAAFVVGAIDSAQLLAISHVRRCLRRSGKRQQQ